MAHRKSSKTPRRSRSNPQIRPRHLVGLDTRAVKRIRYSPDQLRSLGNNISVASECNFPQFRAVNPLALATPLPQRSPDSSFPSYFVPLSDEPSSYRMHDNVGMIKSKSLDKLDEIMRNDPILGEDYLDFSASSKSTQTQTNTTYKKKKTRRKRNDRPRSQILPPTYLQLPSVTWLPSELGSDESLSQGIIRVAECSGTRDYYFASNRTTQRRRSDQDQAFIVQQWIENMIEHKKAQEFRRQSIVRLSVGRERSAKLKKKSRSVPEHALRGNQSKFELRRGGANDYNDWRVDGKLKHSGSDPSFRMSTNERPEGPSSEISASATAEQITPSLQPRIRSLKQSFQPNNDVTRSKNDNNFVEYAMPSERKRSDSSPSSMKSHGPSNPDRAYISHILSVKELDSQC